MSRFDANTVILNMALNRSILTLLMQNHDKVVARRFLFRIAGRLYRPGRRYLRFLINVNH